MAVPLALLFGVEWSWSVGFPYPASFPPVPSPVRVVDVKSVSVLMLKLALRLPAGFVPAVLLVVACLVEILVGMPLVVVVPVRDPSRFLRPRPASLLSAGSATAVSAVTSKMVLVFDKVIALLVVACLVRGACLISPGSGQSPSPGSRAFFLLDRVVVVLGIVGALLALT